MWIARRGAYLALQFAVTGGVNAREWRTCRCQCLRIGHASRGSKYAEKLVALSANAAEQAQFLQNHSPRDDRKEQKQTQDGASNQTGLFKNAAEIGGEGCDQKQ